MHHDFRPSFSSRQSVLFQKWRKLQNRIERKIENGSFYHLSRSKQSMLLQRFRRYYRQLQRLGISAKRLAAGGALALSLALAAPAQAQTFVEQSGADTPLDMVNLGYEAKPAFADVDGDGDLDVFIGEAYGTITFYLNTGSNTSPAFTEQTGADNPFDGIDFGYYTAPALADIDGDGDLDAIIGKEEGTILFYENTGTASSPAFTLQTGADDPFDGIDVGLDAKPNLADIDGDGDLDLFIGEAYGAIFFYENTGSASSPTFMAQTGADNPLDGVDLDFFAVPFLEDIDGDGDLDALIGENTGLIKYYENTGDSSSPTFAEQTGADNPFDGVNVGGYAAPVMTDIDDDGDMDVFIGDDYGMVSYYENTLLSSVTARPTQQQVGVLFPNPAVDGQVSIEYHAAQSADLTIRLLDVSGQILSTQTRGIQPGSQTVQLDVSGLNQGIYFIEIGALANNVQRKLVIE